MTSSRETPEDTRHRKEQQARIKSYTVGSTDCSGRIIREIYASGEEFVVYTTEGDESVFVYVDTLYEEDVRGTTTRYRKLVPIAFQYKNAKHKAENIDLFNSTFALAISIALGYSQGDTSDALDNRVSQAKEILSNALDEYDRSYAERLKGKFIYFLVCFGYTSFFIFVATVAYFSRNTQIVNANLPWFEVFGCGAAGVVGGLISTIIKLPELTFEKGIGARFYAVYAFERMLLAFFCGAIVWVLAKSNIALGFLQSVGYLPMLAIGVMAGFTERLVPELITKSQMSLQKTKE